jgi:hypothetical protein
VIVTSLPFTVTVIGTVGQAQRVQGDSAGHSPPRHFHSRSLIFHQAHRSVLVVSLVDGLPGDAHLLALQEADDRRPRHGAGHPLDELPHPLAGRRGVVSGMELTGVSMSARLLRAIAMNSPGFSGRSKIILRRPPPSVGC